MKVKQYIDKIKNKINEMHKKNEKSSEIKSYLYMALGIFGCTFGIIALSYSFPLALAGIGTMISGISGYINNTKRNKINESAFNKEISHLDKIGEETIDVSDQATSKRNAKYKKLKDKIMPKHERVEKCKKIELATNICGVAACAAGIMFGGLIAGLPLVVAGYKALSDRASTKDYEDYMQDRIELDNLTSEINLVKSIKNNIPKNNSTNQTNVKSKNKSKNTNQTNVKSNNKSKNTNQTNKYSKDQIIAVDEIINSFVNSTNTTGNIKTMIKK